MSHPLEPPSVTQKTLIGWINEPKKAGFEGTAQLTAVNCRKAGYAVQISAVLVRFCSLRNFEEKLFVLPHPFLFSPISVLDNITTRPTTNQTMTSTSTTNSNNTMSSLRGHRLQRLGSQGSDLQKFRSFNLCTRNKPLPMISIKQDFVLVSVVFCCCGALAW
jgi:hypothetical protein